MIRKIVYIYGYYGKGNLGDELLLHICKSWLHNKKKITVRASNSSFNSAKIKKSKKLKLAYFYFLEIKKFFFISRKIRCFVFGGGSILNKSSSISTFILINIYLTICLFRKVPIIGIGMGVSLDNNILKKSLLRNAALKINKIFARDLQSHLSLKSLSTKINSEVSADLAFSMRKQINISRNKYKKNFIGLTVSPQFLSAKYLGNKEKVENSISQWIRLIEIIIQNGMCVKLLSCQSILDNQYFDRLTSMLNTKLLSKIERKNLNINNYTLHFSNISLVVGMRYHSIVLAMQQKVPCIGIGFDEKIVSLCTNTNQMLVKKNAFIHNKIDWSQKLKNIPIAVSDKRLEKLEKSAIIALKRFRELCLY